MNDLASYIERFHEHGYREAEAELFALAWDHLEAAYLERLAQAAGGDRWRDRFRSTVQETFRLTETAPAQARFMVVDSLEAGEIGRRRQRALGARLVALIDTAREEVREPDRVAAATARWIAATLFDRVYRHLTTAAAAPLHSQLREVMFLATSAYFGTEAGLRELSD